MQSIERPAVQKARQNLQALSDDEQARHLAFVRERALRDEMSEKAAAEARGEARGRLAGKAEGEREGKQKGQSTLLHRQLQAKFSTLPANLEQRLQNASEDELAIWAERVLFAESLEQVFAN